MAINTGKTRVAVVGAGFIADLHLEALSELTWVDVVAVCDPRASAAEGLAKKWGVSATCRDIEELEKLDAKPHVAHLLVPPTLHEELIDKLLDMGIGVFAEKPMTLDSASCARLTEKAKDKGLKLGVNHNMCFHPAFLELKKRVDANEIGPVQFVMSILNLPLRQLAQKQFGNWMLQEPQNILYETGCHPFSMVHSLLGECLDARTRLGDTITLPGGKSFHKSWRTMLDCEGGHAMAYMSMGREFLCSRVFAIGPDGSLEADLVTGGVVRGIKSRFPEFWDIATNERDDAARKKKNARKAFFDYTLGLAKMRPRNDHFYATMRNSVRAFHEDVRDDKTMRMGGPEARAALVYIEKIWEGSEAATAPAVGQEREAPKVAATPAPKRKDKRGKRVLLTGGTGFIGSHVIERLVRDGYDVRCLMRNAKYCPDWMEDERVERVAGNTSDMASVRAALDGCDHVIHMATALFDDWESTKRGNVDTTEEFAAAALARGVERFVFTSTIAALYVGDLGVDDTVPASHPVDPQPKGRSLYARGKILGEQVLEALVRTHGLPLINLRPAVVIGPRGRTRASGVGYWPTDNHCLGWGDGHNALPFVLAEDCADAIVASLHADGVIGKTFNLSGDVRMTAREYVAHLAEISGRPIQFHPQRMWTAQGVDLFKWLVKAAVRKPGNQFPSYRDLTTRALKPSFDTSPAKKLLDWKPCSDLEHFIENGIRAPIEEGG